MMKQVICMALLILALGSSFANAESMKGVYVEPKMLFSYGVGEDLKAESSTEMDDFSTKFGGALSVGYDFNKAYGIPHRVELEYSLRDSAKFSDGADVVRVNPQTLFVNGYYDIHNSTLFTPYVTVGAGVSTVNYDTNFAWNVGAGVSYQLVENWDLDLTYRFVDLGEVDNNGYKGDMYSHDFLMGLRYTF